MNLVVEIEGMMYADAPLVGTWSMQYDFGGIIAGELGDAMTVTDPEETTEEVLSGLAYPLVFSRVVETN